MQNARAVLTCAKLPELVAGKNAISGGFRETEENVPTTMPAGVPSSATAVTTATPVGECPSVSRDRVGSMAWDMRPPSLPLLPRSGSACRRGLGSQAQEATQSVLRVRGFLRQAASPTARRSPPVSRRPGCGPGACGSAAFGQVAAIEESDWLAAVSRPAGPAET